MDEFESKFQNAKISALKEFYGKEKPGFEDGGRVAFGEGTRANQHSKMRTLEELQKIIDNAPQMPAGDKFLDMNAKDLTGESVNAIKYNRNPNYPGREKGIEYITRKEMDKFGKKGSNELVFKKQGKQKIKDINKFNYFENLKGLQPSGLNYKGDSSKNLIHPYPKVIETTTGTTGEGNARINRSLSGYDMKARPIAVKQVELIKNKENMSPDDFNKERMKLNAQAKQVRENIVSKKGNIAKNYTGYYRVNEQGIFEPKGFNAKKSFAGIGGEDIKFNNMTKDQLAKFKQQNLTNILTDEVDKLPKNMEIIKKANTSLALVLKKAGFKSNGEPTDPRSYLSDINKQAELAKKGKSGSISKFNNTSTITKKLFTGIAAIDAPGLAIPFSAYSIKKLINDVSSGKKTNTTGADISLAPAFTHLAAKELGLYDKAATGVGKKLLRAGLTPKLAAKLLPGLSYGSTLALPFIETGIQGYNAYKDLEEARKNSSVFEERVPTLLGDAPKSYYNKIMSEVPEVDRMGAASGGIAGLLKKWKTQP